MLVSKKQKDNPLGHRGNTKHMTVNYVYEARRPTVCFAKGICDVCVWRIDTSKISKFKAKYPTGILEDFPLGASSNAPRVSSIQVYPDYYSVWEKSVDAAGCPFSGRSDRRAYALWDTRLP